MDIRPIGNPLHLLRARFSGASLSSRALQVADNRARAIAERYAEVVQGHIEDQDLDWEPLSERYRQWKIDNNLNPGIWIARGELFDAVTFWRGRITSSAAGTRTGWLSGIPRRVTRTTGENMFTIARALEFGVVGPRRDPTTGRETIGVIIPARPLFLPSARQVINEARVAFS